MEKSIYGYMDVFNPKHIYMTPNERVGFKFLLENPNFETCKVGRKFYSLKTKSKDSLMDEYSKRILELKKLIDEKVTVGIWARTNINIYIDKLNLLQDSQHKDFVCFEGYMLFKAN